MTAIKRKYRNIHTNISITQEKKPVVRDVSCGTKRSSTGLTSLGHMTWRLLKTISECWQISNLKPTSGNNPDPCVYRCVCGRKLLLQKWNSGAASASKTVRSREQGNNNPTCCTSESSQYLEKATSCDRCAPTWLLCAHVVFRVSVQSGTLKSSTEASQTVRSAASHTSRGRGETARTRRHTETSSCFLTVTWSAITESCLTCVFKIRH